MKTLRIADLSSTRILKNEELLSLKGGEGIEDCHCMCYSKVFPYPPMGLMVARNQYECTENCDLMNWTGTFNCLP